MAREEQRRQAQMDLEEALSLAVPAPPAGPGLPPPRPPMPMGPGAPPGALGMGGGPPSPLRSPLQATSSFKSPPVAAALQGPQGMQGHPALTRPTGFAEGGYVVFPRGR